MSAAADSEEDEAARAHDGITSAEVRLLTELGMVAAGRGFTAQAQTIFEALRLLRPQRPFPYIGLALARMGGGQHEEAIGVLEREGLAACPGDPDIRAFLGLALRLAGRGAESARVLEALQSERPEADAARLARSMLAAP